jgi:hypothetical protein
MRQEAALLHKWIDWSEGHICTQAYDDGFCFCYVLLCVSLYICLHDTIFPLGGYLTLYPGNLVLM